jgi:uncharacterized membrane protein YczE
MYILNIIDSKKTLSSSKLISNLWRTLFFIIGIFILSIGLVATIQAGLGVSPWTVLEIGLHFVTPWSIGFWNVSIGALLLLITYYLNRQIPKLGTMVSIVLGGFFIDLIIKLQFIPPANHWWAQGTLLIIGIILMGLGTALYLSSEFGAGSRDGLMLALSKRLRWSIRLTRTLMEVTVVFIGWLLGGPVFIGTVLFSISIGPTLQFLLPYCNSTLKFLTTKRVQ